MPAMQIGPYSFEAYCEKVTEFHSYPAPGVLMGGFLVSASWSRGNLASLEIAARRTATLRLALPESWRSALPTTATWQDGVATVAMQPGDTLRLG